MFSPKTGLFFAFLRHMPYLRLFYVLELKIRLIFLPIRAVMWRGFPVLPNYEDVS
jgi:hypothetical protein